MIEIIGHAADNANRSIKLFNEIRLQCEDHKQNTLTKDHNCFHGNTKTECKPSICPLKGE